MSVDAGFIASTVYGGSGKDSIQVANGASTAALIDGGVGNDFLSIGGLSGTSSLLGGAGEDTITVAGANSQWLLMLVLMTTLLYITNAAERSTVKGGVVLTASTSVLSLRVLSRLVPAMTPSRSPEMVLPVHR